MKGIQTDPDYFIIIIIKNRAISAIMNEKLKFRRQNKTFAMLRKEENFFSSGNRNTPCLQCYIPPPERKFYGRPLTLHIIFSPIPKKFGHRKIYHAFCVFQSSCGAPPPLVAPEKLLATEMSSRLKRSQCFKNSSRQN